MRVPSSRVNNTDFDSLPKNALVVKLAHAGGVMRAVVTSSSLLNRLEALNGRQADTSVLPDASNTSQVLKAVDVVGVSLNAGAGEDVALKVLDNFNVALEGNVATSFG